MRPVNLLPPEDRRGDNAPLRAGAASYAIIGVLAVALVGVVLVILTGNQITDSKTQIAALQARQAQATLNAAKLSPYQDFASLEAARSETVSNLAQSRFDWERVLNELALVIPANVTLENLTGTAAAGTSVGGEGTETGGSDSSITGPSLQISGCAEGQTGVARLLAALKDIDGVTRVGMQSSTLNDETATTSGTSSDGSSTQDSCAVKPSLAQFEITVAFDAVPASAVASGSTATPATATTPTTTTSTSTTTTATTDDAGVAAAQAEQQSSVDSANEQVSDAKSGAAAVGVGN